MSQLIREAGNKLDLLFYLEGRWKKQREGGRRCIIVMLSRRSFLIIIKIIIERLQQSKKSIMSMIIPMDGRSWDSNSNIARVLNRDSVGKWESQVHCVSNITSKNLCRANQQDTGQQAGELESDSQIKNFNHSNYSPIYLSVFVEFVRFLSYDLFSLLILIDSLYKAGLPSNRLACSASLGQVTYRAVRAHFSQARRVLAHQGARTIKLGSTTN